MKSIYESWGPEDLPVTLHPFYEIKPTGDVGCDTGRTRFRVVCNRCKKVLHPNTTWPTAWIENHEGTIDPCPNLRGSNDEG